jgi:hypothetical protein
MRSYNMRKFLLAAWFIAFAVPAFAQSVIPSVQGPNGPVAANPISRVDSGSNFVGNRNVTLATLTAVGLGTVNGADQSHPSGRGLHLVVDVTAITGTGPSITVVIEAKDPASGKYYTILSSTALNAVATTVLKVYPGLVVAANTSANDVLPATWRVRYVIAGTSPVVTGTIGALYVD